MDALGQLTGGIAHDFNNLLTAVIGNLELVQQRSRGDPQIASVLQAALGAAERGTSLIQNLLTFARRKPLYPRAVEVSAVVDNVEKILKQTISSDIRLLILANPDLGPAWVLCHEHHRSKRRCGTVREMKEGPSGSAIRSLIPSHRKLLWSKVTVVSVAETPGR